MSQVTKIEEMKEKGAPVDWVSNSPNFSTVGAYASQPKPAASRRSAAAGRLRALRPRAEKFSGAPAKLPMRRGVPTQSKSIDKLLESGNLHPIKDAQGI